MNGELVSDKRRRDFAHFFREKVLENAHNTNMSGSSVFRIFCEIFYENALMLNAKECSFLLQLFLENNESKQYTGP